VRIGPFADCQRGGRRDKVDAAERMARSVANAIARGPKRDGVDAIISGVGRIGATRLGPVNTTDASANEPLGVQGKADDAARTGRPGQEDNAAMRAERFIPSGLPA
jgi:hypothetical protein